MKIPIDREACTLSFYRFRFYGNVNVELIGPEIGAVFGFTTYFRSYQPNFFDSIESESVEL